MECDATKLNPIQRQCHDVLWKHVNQDSSTLSRILRNLIRPRPVTEELLNYLSDLSHRDRQAVPVFPVLFPPQRCVRLKRSSKYVLYRLTVFSVVNPLNSQLYGLHPHSSCHILESKINISTFVSRSNQQSLKCLWHTRYAYHTIQRYGNINITIKILKFKFL